MVYICNKPAGSCKTCEHYRLDEDRNRMACFAQADSDEIPVRTRLFDLDPDLWRNE